MITAGNRRLFFPLLCLIASLGVVFGAEDEKAVESGSSNSTSSPFNMPMKAGSGFNQGGGSAFQILGSVAIIFVIGGAGLAVLYQRGFVGGIRGGGKQKRLQIEETRMLGHRQYLVVAEYDGKKMLLGVCPGRIDYLCPLDFGGEGEPKFSIKETEVSV